MNERLQHALRQLRLSGLAESLEVRLQEAAGNRLTHAEFLELILQDELAVRGDRQIQRRIKAAGVPRAEDPGGLRLGVQPVDQQASRSTTWPPAGSSAKPRMCCCSDRPGVGKSLLVQAIGYQAIKAGFLRLYRSIFDVVRDFLHDEALGGEDKVLAKYLKPDLLIVDDMGMKQLPKRSGEYPVRDHHAAVRDPLAR